MTFGWGRRSCAGQYLAEQGINLAVARLLWGFRIDPAMDSGTGKEIPVNIFAFTYVPGSLIIMKTVEVADSSLVDQIGDQNLSKSPSDLVTMEYETLSFERARKQM